MTAIPTAVKWQTIPFVRKVQAPIQIQDVGLLIDTKARIIRQMKREKNKLKRVSLKNVIASMDLAIKLNQEL